MTHELSKKTDSSQPFSLLQINLLTIILKQILSHERDHSFHLGSTRRQHIFRSLQTYLPTSQWSKLLRCSDQHVLNLVSLLESRNVLKRTRFSNWSAVEIVSIQRVEKILDSRSVGTDQLRLAVEKLGLIGTDFTPQKTVSNRVFVGTEHPLSDKQFCLMNKVKAKQKNKQSDAVPKGQQELIQTSELPEERRSKRMATLRVVKASELLKNPSIANANIKKLIEFNDRLADLRDGILSHRPRTGVISRRCFDKWRQMNVSTHPRSRVKDFFLYDMDEIFTAIGLALGAHGTSWFRFEWLLSFEMPDCRRESVHSDHNIEKLLSGNYRNTNIWVEQQRKVEKIMSKNCSDYEKAGDVFDNSNFI